VRNKPISVEAARTSKKPKVQPESPQKIGRTVLVVTAAITLVSIIIGVLAVHFGESKYNDEFTSTTLSSKWTWVDSSGDCSYSLTENPGYVRIILSSGEHDLYPDSNHNAPRIIQSANGDFVIETKVLFNPQYNAQGAGILIWEDSNNYLRLNRLEDFRGQLVDLSGENGGSWSYFAENQYTYTITYLRVARTKNTFTASYSSDGVNWIFLSSISFPLIDPVRIGLFAINQWQNNPVYADFDYFRVTV
jgi:cytochrome c